MTEEADEMVDMDVSIEDVEKTILYLRQRSKIELPLELDEAMIELAAGIIEAMLDKIDGVLADLDGAVGVAYNRGATEWVKLNYPAHYERLANGSESGDDSTN